MFILNVKLLLPKIDRLGKSVKSQPVMSEAKAMFRNFSVLTKSPVSDNFETGDAKRFTTNNETNTC